MDAIQILVSDAQISITGEQPKVLSGYVVLILFYALIILMKSVTSISYCELDYLHFLDYIQTLSRCQGMIILLI